MQNITSPAKSNASKPVFLRNRFGGLYNTNCRIYRAPGRINLIGEHTDYNGGFVMPVAIEFYCWVAVAASKDRRVEVHSDNFKERRTFHLDHPEPHRDWSDYVQGVALMLEEHKSGIRLPGARILISSDVPIGSGLSSSAALEVAVGYALLDTQARTWEKRQLVLACQRAENEFVGARCGIMDQFISCHGKAGHAVMLDCRSLEHTFLRLPEDARLVICNTMVKHSNAESEYNARRAECEEGVHLLSARFPTLTSLRELTLAEFESYQDLLPPVIRKRCGHVLHENRRVMAAAQALESGDLAALGRLMAESHCSLRNEYDVSSPELDLMVDLARQIPGIWGARMTGGGFGGCTVNVVKAQAVTEFTDKIAARYKERTGMSPEIHVATAAAGAEPWDKIE